MNIIAVIILVTLVVNFIISLISEHLNKKKMYASDVPPELADIYTDEQFSKAKSYYSDRLKMSSVSDALGLIAFPLLWFLGGFPYLESVVSGITDSEIYRGLLFIGILVFAQFLIGLPFSIYSTFVIEAKYGFNKMTVKTFALDLLKSTLLSMLIGLPILAAILWVFGELGNSAWLIGFLLVTAISFILSYIAPTWIMPIFNKFVPLEAGSLRDKITAMAEKAKFPLTNIFVIDGSKRSTKSNAFFTGFGKNKRIALYDTLIQNHSEEELVAVLAHEIGHYKLKHITQGMAIGIVHTFVLFFLLGQILQSEMLYTAFYMTNMPIYAGLIFFGILFSPIESILSVAMSALSRRNEFAADNFAKKLIGKGTHLIEALKKLSTDNLSNPVPHPFYVLLNYSHPPVVERIRKLAE
ncbi:MAG: peptidase M48 [Ignavibacteriae bacterium HGW-Ignavibacteriae-1]|nr:MAG: peptidase M48 [Ignavibacteriae bacterium HGW-Ignavibacteriae-1]